MKKRKPYYIIIAAILFASIINIFLPYLELPDKNPGTPGNTLDLKVAARDSRMIDDIAKEHHMRKKVVFEVAKDFIRGKDIEKIKKDLEEDEIYIIDVVISEIDKMVADLEQVEGLDETKFGFFGMIEMCTKIMGDLKQNFVNASLVIFCMLVTLILALIAGINMLITKAKKGYRLVKVVSSVNIVLSLIGFLSINAISIKALQVEAFYASYWGIGFRFTLAINAAVLVLAIIATIHEKFAGLVTLKMIFKQKQLILMSLPFIIYALIFNYGPLYGWTMAFQKFKPAAKVQQWIAWDKFEFLLGSKEFYTVFRNTVAMSVINLVLSTLFAIGFALLLNEVVSMKGKKFVQTVSYLPHFLSWIIVCGIIRDVLSMETGVINQLLVNTHLIDSPISFFSDPKYFWWIVAFSVVWKETGWNSIIYLASITSINPDLYEAASIDGAGRFKKMMHITLPGIRPTIFILLIINLGFIMNSGFEVQYILGNDFIKGASEVIDTYVLRYSFGAGVDFSIGTASGIFKSVVSIILIFLANRGAKAAGQERLF